MIERIEFKNFKVLRDTTLPLGRFTLIVGPNGSGKSTALQALKLMRRPNDTKFDSIATTGVKEDVSIVVDWSRTIHGRNPRAKATWFAAQGKGVSNERLDQDGTAHQGPKDDFQLLERICIYALDPERIAQPVQLEPNITLQGDGLGLAGVLDRMRDGHPERFDQLNRELNRWLPEFDRVLFDVPQTGHRAVSLRTVWGHPIPASDLSHGTLLAIAILTLAYSPDPAPLIAFEDPDRGMHPRLLRDVQEALYRLAYPENYGEDRPPVQVIATTHSPYFLDLFKDHPEEIVIAQKRDGEAVFERLSDRPDIDKILADAPLGEVWYSGILGGVPVAP